LPSEKELFVLSAGHFEYPDQDKERIQLLHQIDAFFSQI